MTLAITPLYPFNNRFPKDIKTNTTICHNKYFFLSFIKPIIVASTDANKNTIFPNNIKFIIYLFVFNKGEICLYKMIVKTSIIIALIKLNGATQHNTKLNLFVIIGNIF